MPETPAYREDIATEDELDHVDSQAATVGPDDEVLDDRADDPPALAAFHGLEAPDRPGGSPGLELARRVLTLALHQRGDVEYPPGSDRTEYTDWWRIRIPWCAVLTLWVAEQVRDRSLVPWSGSCAAQVREWKARGRWYPAATECPQPGDLFYVRGGPAGVEHTGFVAALDGEDGFWAIEGNWSHRVARVRRNRQTGHIEGYGRPDYAAAAAHRYVPYPGRPFFAEDPRSLVVTRMGRRLVEERCSGYEQRPGPQWTKADRKSYANWQRKCGLTGEDLDGWPDPKTWQRLRVPKD